MGEIFAYERPDEPLPFSGERMTSAAAGQIEYEHLHRYLFARELCRGLDVLDIASGEGYGAALIAQTARSVVGVELDEASVQHARRAYPRPGLSYLLGDARAIPLADASVDIVVSFETLEHFYEHAVFMAEVRRVLRADGRLLISSPDRDVYSPLNGRVNPFHVHELSRAEFSALLSGSFAHVAMYAQRPLIGSALVPDGGSRAHRSLTFEKRGEHLEMSSGLPRAFYAVAIASDVPIEEDVSSVYVDTSNVDLPHALSQQIDQLRDEAAQNRAAIFQAQQDAQAARAEAEALRQWQQRAQAELGAGHAALEGVKAEAEALFNARQAARAELETLRHAHQAALTTSNDQRLAAAAAAAEQAQQAERAAASERLAMTERLATARAQAERGQADVAALQEQVNAHAAAAAASQRALQDTTHDLHATTRELHRNHEAHHQLLQTVRSMESSKSWQFTAPLRSTVRAASGPSLPAKAARALWWTATLQLPHHAKHFVQVRREARTILGAGLFDYEWYARQAPHLPPGTDLFGHYLRQGRYEGLDPHPLFNAQHYRAQLAAHGVSPMLPATEPLAHFLRGGPSVAADPHPMFSVTHYRTQYKGLSESPLAHYVRVGAAEGASPHPDFDGEWYARSHPETNMNPLVHYLTVGQARGYEPTPAKLRARTRLRRQALGLDLPPPTLSLAVGIVTYNSGEDELRRCLASAAVAIERAGGKGRVILIDNGAPTDPALLGPFAPVVLPPRGNLGFGAAHNLLMAEAFGTGAEVYVAANPDGFFHPNCLDHLVRMSTAAHGRALIEALQFPDEHPKVYDPCDFETPWASGACLAIPRALYAEVGGFDDAYFMYCEDVDLSWRARAAGFAVKTCPMALFYHSVADRDASAIDPHLLKSGLILGTRWAAPPAFMNNVADRLHASGLPVPKLPPIEPRKTGLDVPDFSRMFHFGEVRW